MLKKTTSDKVVRYKSSKVKDDFAKELRKRVNTYFKENNLSPYANTEVKIKGIFAFVMWFLFYGIIMSDIASGNFWLLMLVFLALGFVNIFIAKKCQPFFTF